jgi:hypothetical protein
MIFVGEACRFQMATTLGRHRSSPPKTLPRCAAGRPSHGNSSAQAIALPEVVAAGEAPNISKNEVPSGA